MALVLREVLYVPKASFNLLSVRRLVAYGATVCFHDNSATVNVAGHDLEVPLVDGLYQLQTSVDTTLSDNLQPKRGHGDDVRATFHKTSLPWSPLYCTCIGLTIIRTYKGYSAGREMACSCFLQFVLR